VTKAGEVRDVPFLGNDMKDSAPTMGKPLDPADGPGKADAELAEDELVEETPWRPGARRRC
jgi:hypothetical protein